LGSQQTHVRNKSNGAKLGNYNQVHGQLQVSGGAAIVNVNANVAPNSVKK